MAARTQTIQRWAASKQLDVLLRTLDEFPHIFVTASGKPRPWVPEDSSAESIHKAYKRATTFVHPDRLHGKEPAVIAEAQEILKVLTMAHANPVYTAAAIRPASGRAPYMTPAPRPSHEPAPPPPPPRYAPSADRYTRGMDHGRQESEDFVVPPYVPPAPREPASPKGAMDGSGAKANRPGAQRMRAPQLSDDDESGETDVEEGDTDDEEPPPPPPPKPHEPTSPAPQPPPPPPPAAQADVATTAPDASNSACGEAAAHAAEAEAEAAARAKSRERQRLQGLSQGALVEEVVALQAQVGALEQALRREKVLRVEMEETLSSAYNGVINDLLQQLGTGGAAAPAVAEDNVAEAGSAGKGNASAGRRAAEATARAREPRCEKGIRLEMDD